MSEFSADWLQWREPADTRAREQACKRLESPASGLRALGSAARPDVAARAILDLGAGTGANLRYLAPKLGHGQRWHCIDQDATLLGQLPLITRRWAQARGHRAEIDRGRLALSGHGWDATVSTEQRDLGPGLAEAGLPPGALVTASALLDLVSAHWLQQLIEDARSARCTLLFALSYDGRAQLTPAHPNDEAVVALVNRHQRRDKGFGAALGPSAASVTGRLAAAAGYQVHTARSDWILGPEDASLQRMLIAGWLEAAQALAGATTPWLQGWQAQRNTEIGAGALRIQVGHRDLLAVLTDTQRTNGYLRG